MHFVIILSCIFLPYIQTNDSVSDDAAATDEEHFGKDMYCHFAFGGATDPDHMRLVNSANAEIYGIARLPKHRLDFAWIPELQIADITIVPDDTEDVWGTAYLVPLGEYNEIKRIIDTFMGIKYNHSVRKTIEVEINGEQLQVQCNAFPTIRQPPSKKVGLPNYQRPTKSELQFYIECFKVAELPQHYIHKVSKIPTKRMKKEAN